MTQTPTFIRTRSLLMLAAVGFVLLASACNKMADKDVPGPVVCPPANEGPWPVEPNGGPGNGAAPTPAPAPAKSAPAK